VGQGPLDGPSQRAVQPDTKLITVWKVGDPWRGTVPDTAVPTALDSSARRLGYGLRVEAFPIQGFSSRFFHAFEAHQVPDILVFNNIGVLQGISTPLGSFTGIGTAPEIHAALVKVTGSLAALEGHGWEYLIRTSPNHQAARELALRTPECSTGSEAALPAALGDIAVQSASAYLEGNPQAFEDPDRLHTDVTEQKERQVEEIKACGYWGTDHLAFVQAIASYTSPEAIGWDDTLLVLRKWGEQWRLLAFSSDPVSDTSFVAEIPAMVSLITKPWTPRSTLAPPSLVTPQDGEFPVPAPGARFGDFSWHPSPSAGEVAEIAEFAYNGDTRLFAILFAGPPPTTEHMSAGLLWSAPGIWKWRVWSISDTGAVAVSGPRSFRNH
jgi:hypothetical protein